MQTQTNAKNKNDSDDTAVEAGLWRCPVFTTAGLVLLALRGVPSPGLTEPEVKRRVETVVGELRGTVLYGQLGDLVARGVVARTARERTGKKPCYSWFLTKRGAVVADQVAEAAGRAVGSGGDTTVEARARRVLSLRAELAAAEELLALLIPLRGKVVLEEGSFTVVPGAMRATSELEEILRQQGVYELSTELKRVVVMAKVDALCAHRPALGEWIDARRADLAEERHLRFKAAKKE